MKINNEKILSMKKIYYLIYNAHVYNFFLSLEIFKFIKKHIIETNSKSYFECNNVIFFSII